MTPKRPQPSTPPLPAVAVWAVPHEPATYRELAAMLYAEITWGGEPHHSQVSDLQRQAWSGVRPRWEKGVEKFLDLLARVGHIEFDPEKTA